MSYKSNYLNGSGFLDNLGITKPKTIKKKSKKSNSKRKSPKESATLFSKNMKKKGLDGNMWTITLTKSGVKRWVKNKNSKQKGKQIKGKQIKGKQYLIHDNGGRPFLVVINGKNVCIYKLPKDLIENENTSKNNYTILVKEYKNVKKVFIGKSKKPHKNAVYHSVSGSKYNGNTILLEIKPKKYCHISDTIVEFSTKDTIEKYDSPVGNNDVPYPIAHGTDNIYFLLDKQKYIPKNSVEKMTTDKLWQKIIGKCCPWKSDLDKFKKKLVIKVIHKRLV